MGKIKKHPHAGGFETRLRNQDWGEAIGTRVLAERSRRGRVRLRFAAVVVFIFTAMITVSAGIWQEDAAESYVLAMIDDASGDFTSQFGD